ncbi:MAG: M48 family metalloprotease [Thermodesulfobacteriota bacterium]|jgi:predicted Zn-dependent protease
MPRIKKDWFRTFLFKIIAVFLLSFFFPAETPAMTLQQERELGEKVLQEVKKHWSVVQDPSVNEYISRVGRRILQGIESQPFDYRFYVLNTPDVNAFAVPGGYVFINSGLILLVENEGELAGVICHEIGHVIARHIAKRSEKGLKLSLASLGAILAGILVGGQAAAAIVTTTVAANQTAMLKYSREDEEEADYLGLKFMMQAGYDPHGMLTMLKKFRRITGPAASDPPAYLLTHPAIEERTAELEIQMSRYPQEKAVRNPTGNLSRIQTKLVVEEKDIPRSVTYFENYLKRKPDDPEAFFGLGLAQKRMGALDWAIENFSKAASLAPEDGEIYRELGTAYLLKANLPEAQKNLERARALSPSDGVTHFYLGRVYAEQKLADEALQSFLRAKELNRNLPEIDYHLGMAYGAKGMLGQAYQSLGDYYKSMGDTKTALIHFNKALPYFADYTPERQIIQKEIEYLSPKKKETR